MRKYIILLIIIVFAVSIMYAGVGCKTTATTETTLAVTETTAAVTETAAETTAAELGVKPPTEKVTLNVTCWTFRGSTGALKEETDAAMAKFKEKYPTIDIKMTMPAYADQDALLSTGLMGGQGPDVWINECGGAINGLVKYIDYTLPLDSFCIQEWGPNWKDMVAKEALAPIYWGTGGTESTIALPDYIEIMGDSGFYNKTYFDKFGLTPPKTWDELVSVGEVLKKNNIEPIAFGASGQGDKRALWEYMALDFAGPKVFDAINGKANFTDPEFIATTEEFKGFFDNGLFGKDPFTGVLYMDKITEYYQGKFAMNFMGSWELGVAEGPTDYGKKDKNMEWRIWDLPDWNGDGKTYGALLAPAQVWCINKDISEERQRAAFIFIKECVYGIFATVQANHPSWMAFTDVPRDLSKSGLTEQGLKDVEFFSNSLKNAAGYSGMKYTELDDALNKGLAAVAVGEMTAQKAMEELQAASESLERTY